ncbi:MAG: hypothetical protein WKG01_15825 [Kofleriaceae bacterium]
MGAITRLEARWLMRANEDDDDVRAWVAARDIAGLESLLLDHYLALGHLTCCSIQVGYFIDVDGRAWSDDGTVDEPWMTMTFLKAVGDLLASDTADARAHPWEESSMRLVRRGDLLVMEDVHGSGSVSMPRVEVPFHELVEGVRREGEVIAAIANGLRLEIERRRAGGADAAVLARLAVVEENVASAQMVEELERLVARLRSPP